MIGFFLQAPDKPSVEKLWPLILGDNGIATLLKRGLPKNCAEKLNLILIQLFVEGPISLGYPDSIKLGRFSKKNKSISVKVPLTEKEMLLSECELKELLISKTGQAIDLVATSVGSKVDLDFDELKKAFLRIVHPKAEGKFESR